MDPEARQPVRSTRTPGAGRLAERLFERIDIAPLVFFRILFGTAMLWDIIRYFQHDWIGRKYVEPWFHFTYYGFEWVRPWPAAGMYVHFAVLGAAACGIILGLFYRVCAAIFFVGFTYVFLLEQSDYLNHFYLICLVSLLMIALPLHRAWSLDALLRPQLQSPTVPAWMLWLVRAQVGIVYFYGGIAKLNMDWLRGEPMRMWLAKRTNFPIIGPYFTDEWAVGFFTYGGLALDLLLVPLMLWRRTRPFMFVAAVAFHVLNSLLFQIGIFPWFMLGATLLFFPVDAWTRWVRARDPGTIPRRIPAADSVPSRRRRMLMVCLGVYVGLQLVIPLRHFLYPGNVSWTEEGHRFAWHMKLRTKRGQARFLVRDPATGREWAVAPEENLTDRQSRKMVGQPDMILQFAHELAVDFRARGYADVEVYADVWVSLNGRKPQRLIDPSVNLAATRRSLLPADWILPLHEPLPGRGK